MNKRSSILLILLLICNSISFAQNTSELKAQALKDATTTSQATLNLDFKTVLKHTYPSVVSLMGGTEKAVTLLESTFDTMKTQGLVFEKADIISVSDIVFEQNQYRCYVEGFNQITMNGIRISSKSFLLGIYNETDKFWYFIEAKQLKNAALIDQVLPNFKTSMVIPDDIIKTETIKE